MRSGTVAANERCILVPEGAQPNGNVVSGRYPSMRLQLWTRGRPAHALHAQGLVQRHVAGRKGVGPAQGAQGDVLGRPVADAGQLAQGGQGGFHIGAGRQIELAAIDGTRQRHDGGLALAHDAQLAECIAIGRSQYGGRGKQPVEPRPGCVNGRAKLPHQALGLLLEFQFLVVAQAVCGGLPEQRARNRAGWFIFWAHRAILGGAKALCAPTLPYIYRKCMNTT